VAINLPGGFSILNLDPIDARFVVADQSERLGFSSANVYEGLLVYQEDNNKLYVLTDTSNYNQTSGWTEVINESADLSALNTFTGSIQFEVDSLTAATSSYLTSLPIGLVSSSAQITSVIDDTYISSSAASSGFGSGVSLPAGTISSSAQVISSLPSGVISGSSQITITESQISDLTHYTDSDVKTKLNVENVISSSAQVVSSLPSGVISGSSQITITESQISDLTHTDVSSLNTFTSSIQSEVDSLIAVTSSYITEIPNGTVSSSIQIVANLVGQDLIIKSLTAEQYVISSSVTYMTTSFSSGSTIFGDSVDDTHEFTGSLFVLGNVTANSFTGSLFGTSSWAVNAVTASYIDPTFISASAAASGFGGGGDSIPSGTISSSQQITDLGFISSSHTDISALNTFTGSIQSEVDSLTAATSSYLTEVPSGTLSGSAQVEAIIDNTYISASAAASGFGTGGEITYISESGNLSLSQIEVADFDDNVAVTFTGGKLKFIFGSPTVPSSLNSTLSGFATDRFNKVTDGYNVNGSWNNGGYTLISASLFEGATLLTQVGSGTSLSYSTTTSGSHTYKLEYTASSPLDGTIYTSSDTVSGTLSKSNPGNPSISATPSVQLGASSNQIEQGATGSITFSVSYGSSNSWEQVSLSSTPTSSPIYVTGSATGSSSIVIGATAEYQSPAGDNDPQISSTRTNSTTYSKIRSVRYGASTATSFTQSELEDLSSWDTSLGGSIGTIDKGNTTPSGDTITITWTGNKYHYIVFDSSRSDLTNITTSGFGVFASFTKSVVGNYKIYRSNDLQSDSGGGSITYVLT